jgi:hypothetical protein
MKYKISVMALYAETKREKPQAGAHQPQERTAILLAGINSSPSGELSQVQNCKHVSFS